MKTEKGVFNNRTVPVFLYLLHRKDYPYSMAKNFKIVGTKKGSKDICYASKLSSIMKKMENQGLIIKIKEKGKRGRPLSSADTSRHQRSIYRINPRLISTPKIIDGYPAQYYDTIRVEIILEFIEAVSPEPEKYIDRINSLKKYDALTVFVYLRQILIELTTHKDFSRNKLTIFKSSKERLKRYGFLKLEKMEKAISNIKTKMGKIEGNTISDRNIHEYISDFIGHLDFFINEYVKHERLEGYVPKMPK